MVLLPAPAGTTCCYLGGRGGPWDVLPPASAFTPLFPLCWERKKINKVALTRIYCVCVCLLEPPPCPLLSFLSRIPTVLQLLSSLAGRRFHKGTCLTWCVTAISACTLLEGQCLITGTYFLPSSSIRTVTGPLSGGTSFTVAL